MNIFISDAFAATTSSSTSSSLMSTLPLIILLVAFMYFMVIRPQSKKAKEQKNLLDSLQKGDEVITIGGLLGKIEKIGDNFIVLNLAENTTITIQKSAVANIVPKGTAKTL